MKKGEVASRYQTKPKPKALEPHRCQDCAKFVERRNGRRIYQCQVCAEIWSVSED